MRDKKVRQRQIHLWWESGFTLVELMVVMVIVSIIITSIIGVMLSTRKTAKLGEILIEAQQNARFACDVMTADIRCAGYGIDASNIQGAIVYAGPFEIIFNANMTPYPDSTTPPGDPGAINIGMGPKDVPPGSSPVHYSPGQTFSTGAETIRYTIDYNNDGVISAVDKTSPEATRTTNPNDYLLIKQVYGELADGTNGGENQELALVRGPDAWPGQTTGISPLFEYWLDHDNDPTTPDILFGDTDNSGDLSVAEINALNTQVPNPDKITRVTINVIGETREPYTGENYRSVKMTTAINTLRNNPPQFRLIKGHVYLDADTNGVFEGEVGIDSILVSLHTGQICYTGLGGLLQGMYEFSVLPGSYTVKVTLPAGYALTTASSFVAYARTHDVDSTSANLFGLKTVALGYLTGVVFDDSLYTNREWDTDSIPPEPTIPGVQISVTSTHQVINTDSIGRYFFKVNAGDIHLVTEADPDSYISTGAQTIPSAGVVYTPIGPNDVCFSVSANCTAKINFGDKKGASGKIIGFVFEDVGTVVDSLYEPEDGDVGIPNVLITVSQGAADDFVTSTVTDVDGSFSVIVPINPIPDPTYNVLETDPGGFNSINSNRVEGLRIPNEGDSVIVRPFADKRRIVISLSGRALTVITPNLMEDTDVDNDIVMGKGKNGENLLVWYNQYLSPGNPPPEELFNPNRDDARTCAKTIHALSASPINDDNLPDVVSVMGSPTDNIWVWFTLTGPPKKDKGKLPASPDKIYSTIIGGEKAISLATGLLGTPRGDIAFNDNYFDVAVGTRKGVNSGVLEVWLNQRPDSIALLATDPVDVHETAGASDLGEVKGIAIADVVGTGGGAPDGKPDIILATITGVNTGEIVIFRNMGTPGPGNFSWHKTLPASGEVNCVAVLDLLEDVDNDKDIVIGTKTGDWTGKVEIWHNNNDGTFGNGDATPTYIAEVDSGAVQCIGLARLYPDVYPDIVVGLKTSVDYIGKALLYDLAYGKFPVGGPTDPAGGFYTGEMVTLSIADFDKDGKNDFIIGERTSATVGHLLIFFQ